jgi:hypothetical protein
MSYFEDASLVLIPSAQKLSKIYSVKPTDGTGDLTFTRSNDTATRVGPDGLIEKVRTNLATYSSDFSTAGLTIDATVSTNTTTDPFGTTLADSLLEAATTGNHLWYRDFTVSNGTELTFSIYVKSIGGRNVRVAGSTGTGSELAVVDLANGSILASSGAVSVTSAGSGWYRISLTTTTTGTTARFIVYAADGTSISYAGNTSKGVYLFGHQVEYGVMTDYIATTTAAVSVGPVANVPRLDYLGSSCPRLLLEPQRTNLAQFSEQLDNAAWTKNGVSVTANSAVSPDGYTNADKIVETATTGPHGLTPTYSIANSTTYTLSIFAKKAENDYVIMNIYTGATSNFTSFNVANGTIGTTGAGATAKIENYGNGWYRCSLTATTAATGSPNIFMWTARANDTIEYTGNGTNGTFLYGCQLEAGAYATSYIPTLGSASTRGSDAASKTSATALIGQTEGTLFAEIDLNLAGSNVGYYALQVYDSAASPTFSKGAYIELYQGKVYGYVRNTTVQCEIISSTYADNTRLKIAIAYKANDFALYVNGVQIGTDTSGSLPSVLNSLSLHYSAGTQQASPLSQALLFKTRLSNADLAALTA